MRPCPRCKQWTLDFDDYFGRYRCFNPDCEWMPMSTAEREIRLLKEHKEPDIVSVEQIPELGVTVTVSYDSISDVLAFDFDGNKSAFRLPEPDGRFVWKIAKDSNTVVGFEILEAKKLGVSEVQVNIIARKKDIEQNLKKVPEAFFSGKPTTMLISSVAIMAKQEEPIPPLPVVKEVIEKFNADYCRQQ